MIHSDRGSQYTSEAYRKAVVEYGIRQSMYSALKRQQYYDFLLPAV